MAKRKAKRSAARPPSEDTSERGEDDWTVTSYAAVARFFGVAADTIRKDWKARGMPAGGRGRYDLAAIARWRIQHERDQAGATGGGPVDEIAEQLRRARAEAARLDVDRKRRARDAELGEVVSARWVSETLRHALGVFRQRLESLPAERAQLFPASARSAAVEEWRQAIRRSLVELADVGLAAVLGDPIPEPGGDDGAKRKRKRTRKRPG